MSTKDASAKDFSELDAQETQAALAEALDVEIEQPEIDPEAEVISESDVLQLPVDTEDDDFQLFEGDANPFAAAVEFARQVRMVEALLFAASEPLDEATMKKRLPEGSNIKELLSTLKQQYENRGVNLKKTGKKWQLVTAPDVADVLEIEQVQPKKLSRAALETLAIIAYHQPCTRAEIEEVRGVAVSRGSLDQLLEIGWVRLRGRREDTPGRPMLYGTSQEFLEHFGLESVSHLPGMADLKAAGLLDARLPPGFTVPTPKDETGVDGESVDPDAQEFVQDFHSETSEGEEDGEFDELTEAIEAEMELDEEPIELEEAVEIDEIVEEDPS